MGHCVHCLLPKFRHTNSSQRNVLRSSAATSLCSECDSLESDMSESDVPDRRGDSLLALTSMQMCENIDVNASK